MKKNKTIKPKPCELCGVDDGKTEIHCGGFATWMHKECGDIGCKAIHLYLRRLAFMTNGLQYLAYNINEIVDEEMKKQGFRKLKGGGWKKNEDALE